MVACHIFKYAVRRYIILGKRQSVKLLMTQKAAWASQSPLFPLTPNICRSEAEKALHKEPICNKIQEPWVKQPGSFGAFC
jgi:hypothetical protein